MAKNDYTIGDHEKNSKNGRQMGGGLSPMGGRAQGQKVNNFKKRFNS